MQTIVAAQDLDRPLPFETISVSRWENADAWPEGPARSAWTYYLEPVTALPRAAGELDSWLIGPRYRSRWEANQNPQQSGRSIDFFCRSSMTPMVECAIRLDRLSRFYEELASLDPLHADSWCDELAAVAARDLASLEHSFGRYQTFIDDPGSTIVINEAAGGDGSFRWDIPDTRAYFSSYQRKILQEQKARWRGWETVWFGWHRFLRQSEPPRGRDSDDEARIRADLHDGIERVVRANQEIVHLNADAAGFALDTVGGDRMNHAVLLEWLVRGLVVPDRVTDDLGWSDEGTQRRAAELHESFIAFREPERLEAYVDFCAGVLGNGDVQPADWAGINSRWRLANEIRDAEKKDQAEETIVEASKAEDPATWAMGGLVLMELPDPYRAWPWLRKQVGHDAELERNIRQHFQDQRDRLRQNEEMIRATWYRTTSLPDAPQIGELLLASLEAGERATHRFIERLWRDVPEHAEAVRTCLLAFEIERSRRTTGLSLTAGRYKSIVPRFFTGLLASGVSDEQVLELASQEVRLLATKTQTHKRLILTEYNRLRILLQQVAARGDEMDRLAAEARRALAGRAGDLIEDLWTGVDRVARALPEPDRQRYLAWIINDLGGDWTGNPATTCREAGSGRIEVDPALADQLRMIEARMTDVQARIIQNGARGAVADEESQSRIARQYHALCDERYRLLDELAVVLRVASDGADADDLPAEWQLIELLSAEPREAWRFFQRSIDRVIRVANLKDEE